MLKHTARAGSSTSDRVPGSLSSPERGHLCRNFRAMTVTAFCEPGQRPKAENDETSRPSWHERCGSQEFKESLAPSRAARRAIDAFHGLAMIAISISSWPTLSWRGMIAPNPFRMDSMQAWFQKEDPTATPVFLVCSWS